MQFANSSNLRSNAATHPSGFRAGCVDVLEQNIDSVLRNRALLSLSDLLVNQLSRLLLQRLELRLDEDNPLTDALVETLDRVLDRTHVGDLVTGTVGRPGSRHGVSTATVSKEFHDQRTLYGHSILHGEGSSLLDCKDIHTVDLQSGNVPTVLEVLGQDGGTSGGRTHAILVVLTSKDDLDVPELGHVVRLEDLALVRSTISAQSEAGVGLALTLHGESDTGTDGNLGAYKQWILHGVVVSAQLVFSNRPRPSCLPQSQLWIN
jgi:hypothetical protein